MLAQYFEIKKAYPDCLLFFRLGDFYELFFDDAKAASKALDLVLTHRGEYEDKEVPMCGIPFHAYENYLVRLIKAGFKVAICEQMETPEESKKRGSAAIVKREVIRVVTSGTLTEDALLNAKVNNYLVALAPQATACGIGWVDISTGDFFVEEVEFAQVPSVLNRLKASELLIPENFESKYPILLDDSFGQQTTRPANEFLSINQVDVITKYPTLTKAEQIVAGVILNYLKETQLKGMPNLSEPQEFLEEKYMSIDGATRRSLELTTTLSDERGAKSLLSTIDRTVTGAGARLLATYLSSPLIHVEEINVRLDKIKYFVDNAETMQAVRSILKETSDIERSFSRLAANRGGPRDMLAIAYSLEKVPSIRNRMIEEMPLPLKNTTNRMGIHGELCDKIKRFIREDAPLFARDGGFIQKGASAVLDEFDNISAGSKKFLMDLQYKYAHETNIQNLKVAFNNLVGYYVEVPAKQADVLFGNPQFIHRQTMTNVVRFTTVELSEEADKILHVEDRKLAVELELYEQLRQEILADGESILMAASALAELDVATALAELSLENHWCRPVLNETTDLKIIGGRHPVVEEALKKDNITFIPNDCAMTDKDNLWLLTGPNMAGKSTYLRQNALIVILAQMGSYVPAESAKIGIVDKIFSRVGASDDLARGRSTFMVEMVEVASILNNATERSLVILDEVGRGTATYDGLSLAWAVVEYLHDSVKARALFATHYHELTGLTGRLKRLSLHTMKIKEWQGDVVFLHEVTEGAVARSYGIHVAKLAGLPSVVVDRASSILEQLEEKKKTQKPLFDDLPLFSQIQNEVRPTAESEVEKKLKALDVDALSPREALALLYTLKREAEPE
ncbi:MAG: DNA mismatch repair protein MutS [Alphaproteobacteria bacterium]|nr:DNA mismatch repair protein MutS [Alphaproteobacteria bacterium]